MTRNSSDKIARRSSRGQALGGDGTEITPGEGIIPILRRIGQGRYEVTGTGFYITRYGLFVSAGHVLQALTDPTGETLEEAHVLHDNGRGEFHVRRVHTIAVAPDVDLGVGQAENFVARFPDQPLQNRRAPLSTELPAVGSELITYAYPGNAIVDFSDQASVVEMRADYFRGTVRRQVAEGERFQLTCSHLETTIYVAGGASGGPVSMNGKVIGACSTGFDFNEDLGPEAEFSRVVPVSHLLDVVVRLRQVPEISAEYHALEDAHRPEGWSVRDLADANHVSIDK